MFFCFISFHSKVRLLRVNLLYFSLENKVAFLEHLETSHSVITFRELKSELIRGNFNSIFNILNIPTRKADLDNI